ncbi:MAG: sialate O-acetylesterase, partial [Planctomycetota bacterium]
MHRQNTASNPLVFLVVAFIILFSSALACADIRLPSIIGDNMVLQSGEKVALWGWADAGEVVHLKVSWHTMERRVTTGADGKWTIQVKTPPVGGPYQIALKGKNAIALKNILVGEVWVCSGQSNMQWSVQNSNSPQEEIAAAKYPKIRLFSVQRKVAQTPQADCEGSWAECSPETIPGFTAVGYFFGRELHKKLAVPIGLIHTSWGGTPAEAWTSGPMMKTDAEFAPILKRWREAFDNYPRAMVKYKERVAEWEKVIEKAKAEGKKAPRKPYAPMGPGHPHSPSGLYNAMIAPLIPYGIQGAIWYQGESNASRAYQYRKLFPTMIRSWRKNWGQGAFPFGFVQLANFRQVKDEPAESDWAELREAQTMTLGLPNTGMAVIIDIGEADDIHPRNKQDVGKRLALWALAETYGREIVYSGPMYRSIEVKGDTVTLAFEHVGDGLAAEGGG